MIDWWLMNNVYVLSLMRMIDVKWKPIDEDWSRCIDEDGSMSFHWYMMNMDQCGFISIWCIFGKMYRWIIIVLSWLIRCTNGWTPKWSPYGESPHEKILYGLSYPRRKVGGPMLVWGITRWRSRKLLVKLCYMDSVCHGISGGMWNIT